MVARVVVAARHLRVGANGFGWLLAAIGVGALLGPFLSNRLTGGRYLDGADACRAFASGERATMSVTRQTRSSSVTPWGNTRALSVC